MEYKKIEEVSYNLHLIKTNKFKTLFFKIILSEKVEKERITLRNLLIDNLISSSKDYPTIREMNIKKQELYGASLAMANRRIGNHFFLEYTMSILEPRYTEDNMLEESIKLYSDILYKPNITDEKFDQTIFDLSKDTLEKEILMVNENSSLYGFNKFKEALDKDACFSYPQNGYISDLNKITNKDLYKYYKQVLETNPCDIFIVGNFDFNEMEQLIKQNFHFNKNKKIDNYEIKLTDNRTNYKEVEEERTFNQSKLYLGFKIENLEEYEKRYVLVLFNIIFGNSPESKLFKRVREENSLAYSVNSGYRRLDNFYYVIVGLSYKNLEKTKNTINECLEEMKKGFFEDEKISQAKALYKSILRDCLEGQSTIVDVYSTIYYFNNKDLEEQIKEIEKVTKDQIIKVANKLQIDTVYLLKEGVK